MTPLLAPTLVAALLLAAPSAHAQLGADAAGTRVATSAGEQVGNSPVSGDAWVGLAGALVGAVIGLGGALFVVGLTNKEARRQHAHAVRVARETISAEVEVNQENFRADWRWVFESQFPEDVAPVNRAGMYPAPTVITAAWDSQIGLLPEAFSREEALELHRFYASAQSAVAVRQTIQELFVNDTAQQSRNEAFDIYRIHAARVMEHVVPAPNAVPTTKA